VAEYPAPVYSTPAEDLQAAVYRSQIATIDRHIVVLGLMGAGKSTLASALASRLQRRWRDSDTDIERLMGSTGREIAADPALGVGALHGLEEAMLLGSLATAELAVISAAGWVVESALCREAMRRRATVVWLRAPAALLRRRMASGEHRRTSAPGEVEALIRRRSPLFEAVADIVLDASQRSEALLEQALVDLHAP
jgi:shikimate kinase